MRYLFLSYFGFVLLLTAANPVENYRVSGVVRDTLGVPIANVTVREKNRNTATLTASDGSFSLLVSGENAVLMFVKAGFDQQEVKITAGEKALDIHLKFSGQVLNEVVVTYLGSQNRKDIMGSIGVADMRPDHSNPNPDKPHQETYQEENCTGQSSDSTEFNTEEYDVIRENHFLTAEENPLSTFSIDVDGGSYSNVRRYLKSGQLPPAGAVRIEEFINYFHYDYPQPVGTDPFSIQTEIGSLRGTPHISCC
jgi:Ca-activated chloride channel homolog